MMRTKQRCHREDGLFGNAEECRLIKAETMDPVQRRGGHRIRLRGRSPTLHTEKIDIFCT